MHPLLACADCGRIRPIAGRARCGTCYCRWARAAGIATGWRKHGTTPLEALARPWLSPRLRDIPLVRMRPGDHPAGIRIATIIELPPLVDDVVWLARLAGAIIAPIVGEPREPEDRPRRRWALRDTRPRGPAGAFLPVGPLRYPPL